MATAKDGHEGVVVEDRVEGQREARCERRHHLPDGAVAERERAAQQLAVELREPGLLAPLGVLDVERDERVELLPVEVSGDLAPEAAVQDEADRVCD